MAIPKEILTVKRPSSTVVKRSGKRFIVVKRTSKRKDGRVVPVDLGMVGEIVGDRFVERTPSHKSEKRIDIKDYGEVALCNSQGKGLLDELAKVWDLQDAKRIYVMALLRSAYGDVKDRDLRLHYETSFASEMYPGVHLSEQSVSDFLWETGCAYSRICTFMRNRAKLFAGRNIVVDGMLKDYNSETGSLSEFSRKARTKGSRDISILYAFDPDTNEPIAAKPYAGNMPDLSVVDDFISEYQIVKGIIVADKGFWSTKLFDRADKEKELSYIVPVKHSSTLIKKYGMDEPTAVLEGYKERTVIYKKVKMPCGNYLYSFRDPVMASEQEIAYVQQRQRKGKFDKDKYTAAKSMFGLIVFKSKSNLDPLTVYLAYAQRWDIEILFNMYKNILERDTVNVHTDYRVYATEMINFLSVIITSRVKALIVKTGLNKQHSYKQLFTFLSKYKKARVEDDNEWRKSTMMKYVDEIAAKLNV